MKTNRLAKFLLFVICFSIFISACQKQPTNPEFNGNQAMKYASQLMAFGPKVPESKASADTAAYIHDELSGMNWTVEFQDFIFKGIHLRNIIASRTDRSPDVIIAAHYDNRAISDQESDPTLAAKPVPGADDGISGVATLMEMADALQYKDINVWLVFFDGEDQGHINDWDWSIGADYFAQHLQSKPSAVVVIDMIGDKDLDVYREKQSDQKLTNEIWNTAKELGFGDKIIDQEKYAMIDDHMPFVKLGIPSCLMIDFDYPYWHTQSDTLDKISSDSLYTIGQTLLTWILKTYA